MVKKAAETGITVRVKLSPATQVADGSPITVTATAIQNGFVLPNTIVKFEADGSARFSDTSTSTTEGVTGADGRVTKTLSDTVAESGYLVVVLSSGADQAFDEAPYTFTGVPTLIEPIRVDDANGFADGESLMSVGVRLFRADDQEPVTDEPIIFRTLSSTAAFVTPGPELEGECSVNTDWQGQAMAYFVDTRVEMGDIRMFLESDPDVRTHSSFKSRPVPKLQLIVQPDEARANGKETIVATAVVVSQEGLEPMGAVSVRFYLPDWVNCNTPPVSVTTDRNGEAQVSFTSTRPGGGRVSVVAEANPGRYQAEAHFEFLPMPPPTQFGLGVQPTQASADGNQAITATVTVGYWETGERLEGADVAFDVPPWVSPRGPLVVATGEDGTAQLSFTSTVAGQGQVRAVLALDPDKYEAVGQFQFNAA